MNCTFKNGFGGAFYVVFLTTTKENVNFKTRVTSHWMSLSP